MHNSYPNNLTDEPVINRNAHLRMPTDMLETLLTLALVDNTTIGDQILTAVKDYVEKRKHSPTIESEVLAAHDRIQSNRSTD